jgi:hypothetical protein
MNSCVFRNYSNPCKASYKGNSRNIATIRTKFGLNFTPPIVLLEQIILGMKGMVTPCLSCQNQPIVYRKESLKMRPHRLEIRLKTR